MLPDAIYIYPNADKDRFCRSSAPKELISFVAAMAMGRGLQYLLPLPAGCSGKPRGRRAGGGGGFGAGENSKNSVAKMAGSQALLFPAKNAAWRKR